MTNPTSKLRARLALCAMLGVAAIMLLNTPRLVDAQGLVRGVEQGAREGNKAAGPVGGVLGGLAWVAIGRVRTDAALTSLAPSEPVPAAVAGERIPEGTS